MIETNSKAIYRMSYKASFGELKSSTGKLAELHLISLRNLVNKITESPVYRERW